MKADARGLISSSPAQWPLPWALLLGLFFGPAMCWSQGYQHSVDASWDFTTASSPLGWSPIIALPNFGVGNGALTFKATSNAYTIFSPPISVPTAPKQLVEIVMSCDTAGSSKVFWAPAQSGIYNGFQPGDEYDFMMVGDNAFHHYYLPIDTSSAATIYGLRLDVPPGSTVSIHSLALARLIAPSGPGVSPFWSFTSDGDSLGWIPYEGVVDTNVSGGSLRLQSYSNATILAPIAQVTNSLEWFSLIGAVTETSLKTPWINFNFQSTANSGNITSAYFPVVPDSAQHVYNTNVGGASGWFSTVFGLSITISENTAIAISQMQVASAPQGPADLALEACGPATPLIRVGSPFLVSCRVSNRGAQPVQGLLVNLTPPGDGTVRIISSPSTPASLINGYPQTLTWTLVASEAETIQISASAVSQNGGSAQASTTMFVNPPVTAQASTYVPRPVPVHSNYDLGVFYFPGWNLDSHWDPIRNFPERMPALGYYAEGSPQVMDWQIKWAVEHGIKFFAVDWYWGSEGLPATEQGEWPNNFLQAYFASNYHNYIKFSIAYANDHEEDTARDTSEFLEIVGTWIKKYFKRPEYYMFNKMPVVFIDNPIQLDTNLGGSAKGALAAARALAAASRYKGIYFVASTNGNTVQAQQLEADGYDALTSYSYGPVAGTTDPDEASYESMVTGYEQFWDSLTAATRLPYIIPTGEDWDPRPDKPWQYSGAYTFVRTGSSASLYKAMLQAAKDRIDAGKSPPILMVDAWNERGEGHWIEPSAGSGFSYLDAIRSIFADDSPHNDLVPSDLGMPLVQTVPSTALWTFTDPSDLVPWQLSPGPPFFNWSVNISNSRIASNQWTFTSDGNPDLVRMGFNLNALDYSGVSIQMKVSADTNVNIYWGAIDEPGPSALRNVGFLAHAGQMQTYILTLAGRAGWRGIIDLIRISMSCPANTDVAIQSIQFIPSSAEVSIAASASQVSFTWMPGTSVQSSQVVSIDSPSSSGVAWTATSDASWLTLSPQNGTVPANITASVNATGLAPGMYRATITITVGGAADGPLTLPVTLWLGRLESKHPGNELPTVR